MTDKVIEFPKHKVVREVPEEVFEQRNRRADQKMADAMVDDISGLILTELDNYEVIDVTNKEFCKDFILVIDSLKAAIYRQFGFEHVLHKFIEDNVSLVDADMSTLSKEEIQEKIDQVMKDLLEAKANLDLPSEE